MRRQVDEIRWHCGPHRCGHKADDLPITWRYSVISRDFAVSLCLSKTGAEFVMHLAQDSIKTSSRRYPDCDLLGSCEVPHAVSSPSPTPSLPGLVQMQAPPTVSPALMFWAEHAVAGLEQPTSFWRALERRAKSMIDEARRGRYRMTTCPRCHGHGSIEIKPKKKG